MLESGDFVDIRFGQMPRYKKPVGIYWLQAATTAVAGFGTHNEIWTYRLASLLGEDPGGGGHHQHSRRYRRRGQ